MAQLPSFYAEDTPASANELWSRLHSDPLFAARLCKQAVFSCVDESVIAFAVHNGCLQSYGALMCASFLHAVFLMYGSESVLSAGNSDLAYVIKPPAYCL